MTKGTAQIIATHSGATASGLAIGVETQGGTFTPVLSRGQRLPIEATRVFTTVADNQTRVEVHVVQGTSDFAADNESLARFEISGLSPAPKGIPQISITFSIDPGSNVTASARDEATGIHESVTILSEQTRIGLLIEEHRRRADKDKVGP